MAIYYVRLLMLISVLLGIVAVIGSLLPRSYNFESVAVVDAAPDRVFQNVNVMQAWQNWSQWSPQQVEGLQVEYSGNAAGVGAAQTWSDPRGKGKLWIVESTPDQKVAYRLEFAGFPEMESSIELSAIEDSSPEAPRTRVVWASRGKLPGGPFYGFFSPFFANGMKHEYDASLDRLKQLAESQAPTKTKTETETETNESSVEKTAVVD